MNCISQVPDKSISLFVKNILIFEENEKEQKTVLPFFADGYPGLMFQESRYGLTVNPHNKKMPELFLYGQTVKPIEISINGPYKLIVFQLFPFVLNSFFNVNAKELKDSCYELQASERGNTVLKQLNEVAGLPNKTDILSNFLIETFQAKKEKLDIQVKLAVNIILENKGQITISKICHLLNITQRTFERRFVKEVGISPKQFSSIIQFHFSMEQLTKKQFAKLTDIVYQNGFSDQSHFIKVFKSFTGKTPKSFK